MLTIADAGQARLVTGGRGAVKADRKGAVRACLPLGQHLARSPVDSCRLGGL